MLFIGSKGCSAHVAVLLDPLFAYLVFVGLQVGRLMPIVHQQDALINAAYWWPVVSMVTIIVLRVERPSVAFYGYTSINRF